MGHLTKHIKHMSKARELRSEALAIKKKHYTRSEGWSSVYYKLRYDHLINASDKEPKAIGMKDALKGRDLQAGGKIH